MRKSIEELLKRRNKLKSFLFLTNNEFFQGRKVQPVLMCFDDCKLTLLIDWNPKLANCNKSRNRPNITNPLNPFNLQTPVTYLYTEFNQLNLILQLFHLENLLSLTLRLKISLQSTSKHKIHMKMNFEKHLQSCLNRAE